MPSSISNQDVGIVDENQVCEKVVVVSEINKNVIKLSTKLN